MKPIRLRGAAEHNLRRVNLDLPRGQWIAVTGPSGSGKTSLVFDTLVREGQHRYLGALSARARQFFGKLGRARVDELDGLPPAIAIGASDARASTRSTVGTLTGVLDLLRLLYARVAEDPGGVALTRSHFSFNHPVGACEACGGSGVADEVSEASLVADPTKSIKGGALAPTLANGYTVYSQVTLEVMDTICRAHGFDVQTPWQDLTGEQRHVILHGTDALEVPFGKHSIESRMKWEGITARPREMGFYKGLVPVIEETLKRNRNPNVLRYVRSVPCHECDGARLARPGREACVGERTLPVLSATPVGALARGLDALPDSAVLQALRPELGRRLERLVQLGLGHLTLARESTTLSGGEAQRLRLAAQLAAPLSGLLVALDEPTLGLHPSGQPGMRAVLDDLRALGNTLLVVEHDPDLVRSADHLVAIGPGAGPDGGRVVADGPLPEHPLGPPPAAKARCRPGTSTITLRGATLHNLREAELTLHLGTLQVVAGPSGAGKTSLVFGTLLPALAREEGGPFTALEGATDHAVRAIDARPIGRTPRSTPATWSGLMDLVRKRFAATDAAVAAGLGAGHFSFNSKQGNSKQGNSKQGNSTQGNNKAGRCATCEGLGTQRVGLHLLEDLELPCPACGGARYAPEILEVQLRGKSIAEVLALSVGEACVFFADDPPAASICRALERLGLGYLPLGFPSNKLSRGEAQRVKLATLLGDPSAAPTLLALDEPDRGLHPTDVARLIACLDDLVDAGHTVLAISHHRHLWAAADVLVEVEDGVAREAQTPPSAPAVPNRAPRAPAGAPECIELRGVRTHSLQDVDVSIPRGALTAICGVSGSGKSSLAFATLASEASQRYAESLPFQVRRHLKRLPRAELDEATGLGPVIALRQGQARAGRRSTVATQTEIGPLLRLLWSRAGTVDGAACALSAGHFSPDRALGACPDCEGLGAVRRCDSARLVTHPELPLVAGALDGTRVGRYLGEPDGQFVATLRAAAPEVDWARAWSALDADVQAIALEGAGDRMLQVRWALAGTKRTGEGKEAHEFEGSWDGFLALAEREALRRVNQKSAAEWAAPLVDAPCATCGGTRLRAGARAVRLGVLTLPEALALPLDRLIDALSEAGGTGDPGGERSAGVLAALLPDLQARVEDLVALGLGHLELGRASRTLSAGELQRVRLASVLRAGLTGVTLVLDEPTSGLHARDVDGLLERLAVYRERGNTVVVVEHEPRVLRAADHLIELGPGAGVDGGRVVGAGAAGEVLAGDGPTARALRSSAPARVAKDSGARLVLRGCRAHHLQAIDVELPLAGLVAVTGVSGSGKSSLVFDVLAASLEAGRAVECEEVLLHGAPEAANAFAHFAEVRGSRWLKGAGTVLGALELMPQLQRLFHAEAAGTGLTRQAFSFGSPAGRCQTCNGSGRERVALDFLADLALPCPICDGRRYRDEVLAVRWSGWNVAELLDQPVVALLAKLSRGKLRDGLEALARVGLGHLALGRRIDELSGGEAQRVTLAASLASAPSPTLYVFDEPATGLHEQDLAQLAEVFDALGARGDLVVIAEHRLSLIAAADHVIDLGPEGGAGGGRLVAMGPPIALTQGATATALREARG